MSDQIQRGAQTVALIVQGDSSQAAVFALTVHVQIAVGLDAVNAYTEFVVLAKATAKV